MKNLTIKSKQHILELIKEEAKTNKLELALLLADAFYLGNEFVNKDEDLAASYYDKYQSQIEKFTVNSLENYGLIYYHGDVREENLAKSRDIFEHIAKEKRSPLILRVLGLIYGELNNYEKTIENLECLTFSTKSKSDIDLIILLDNAYSETKNYSKSLELFKSLNFDFAGYILAFRFACAVFGDLSSRELSSPLELNSLTDFNKSYIDTAVKILKALIAGNNFDGINLEYESYVKKESTRLLVAFFSGNIINGYVNAEELFTLPKSETEGLQDSLKNKNKDFLKMSSSLLILPIFSLIIYAKFNSLANSIVWAFIIGIIGISMILKKRDAYNLSKQDCHFYIGTICLLITCIFAPTILKKDIFHIILPPINILCASYIILKYKGVNLGFKDLMK